MGLLAEQALFGLQASKGWLAKFGPKLGLAGLAGLGGIWLLKNTEWGQRLAQSVANKLNELSLYGERELVQQIPFLACSSSLCVQS